MQNSTNNSELVDRLVAATGMSRTGVYKCLRENRKPTNELALKAWNRVVGRKVKP